MALSDRQIIAERKAGSIVIEPFIAENLGTSSYDVTLGEWYFREQRPKEYLYLYSPYSKAHVDAVWGSKPERAKKSRSVLGRVQLEGIYPDEKIILLDPGETILAHTNEFIGGRGHITTMMKARSSLGRNFIEVCKCAGWGDVGYVNRWTMEITNNSRHYTIPLVVGRRIAQIVFFETGHIRSSDYARHGKYQSTASLSGLKKSWRPSSMLPKLYADREITTRISE